MMQIESITIKTKQMIDDLKSICANFGLGGSPGEYKIITQVFLYKYLSDKLGYEASKVEPSISEAENVETALTAMSDEDYEMMLMMLGGNVAKLKKNHYISYLFNHQSDDSMKKADGTPYPFHELFDDTLVDIANYNLDIFSVQTGSEEYHLYSGYPTSEELTDLEGNKLKRRSIMLNCLEAGEEAYLERSKTYEISLH